MAHDEVWERDFYGRKYQIGFGVDDDECVNLPQHVLHEVLHRTGFRRAE